MEVIWEEVRRGWPQKVQGPMPSFTQIILPQLRQLGAAARRGWRVARQVQRRAVGEELLREGLVCSSRVRMAESWKMEISMSLASRSKDRYQIF